MAEKTKARNPVKKWKEKEEIMILEYLKQTIQEDKEIEKPTARIFYSRMSKLLELNANMQQIKSKINQMKKSFRKAVEWENQTGQGVEEGSVKDYIAQICPYYEYLSEIFGNKANIQPPFVYDSCEADSSFFTNIIEVDEDFLPINDDFDAVDDIPTIEEFDTDSLSFENSNQKSMTNNKENEQSHPMKKFKKYLGSKTKTKYVSNASNFLNEIQTKRFEVMEQKNNVDELKIKADAKIKESELQLNRDKFECEKELKIKEMEKKYETELEIRKKEIESNEKLEKLRMELALALAKIEKKD